MNICFVENSSKSDLRDLMSELDLLKKLKPHPNVIRLLGCVTKDVVRCRGKREFSKSVCLLCTEGSYNEGKYQNKRTVFICNHNCRISQFSSSDQSENTYNLAEPEDVLIWGQCIWQSFIIISSLPRAASCNTGVCPSWRSSWISKEKQRRKR